MKVENGRIAFHVIRLREDSGADFVQYDFDGSVEYIRPYSLPPILINPTKP